MSRGCSAGGAPRIEYPDATAYAALVCRAELVERDGLVDHRVGVTGDGDERRLGVRARFLASRLDDSFSPVA